MEEDGVNRKRQGGPQPRPRAADEAVTRLKDVREYAGAGHTVVVQQNAGSGIGATYEGHGWAGATVVDTADAAFAADMIVKVKEPQPAEWAQLREDQILFTFPLLAADPEQAKGLLASDCTAVAYETVTDGQGGLPLLAPMSEVTGRLAVEAAGVSLRRHAGRAVRPHGGCSAAWSARRRRAWPWDSAWR